jgi:2-oxoglutarate ferredoxin oxidoreductase subunit alpha
LDFTIEAFNLSEKYRNPACVMTDGEVGHLRERIIIPDEKDMKIIDRVQATIDKKKYIPFSESQTRKNCKVPDFPTFGSGYRTYVTGLTHNEKGFPATDKQPDHERLVKRIVEKISDDADKLIMIEKLNLDDADIAIVTYGATARPAESAMERARKNGIKAGMLRLKLVWPFPEKEIAKLAKNVDKIIVPEMNLGQIVHPVRESAGGNCEVVCAPKIGGEMHFPDEIYKYLEGK